MWLNEPRKAIIPPTAIATIRSSKTVMNKTIKDIVDKKNRENQIDVGTIISDEICSGDKGMKVEQIKLPSKQFST